MNRANIYMLSAFSCFLIVEQVYAGRVPSLAARFGKLHGDIGPCRRNYIHIIGFGSIWFCCITLPQLQLTWMLTYTHRRTRTYIYIYTHIYIHTHHKQAKWVAIWPALAQCGNGRWIGRCLFQWHSPPRSPLAYQPMSIDWHTKGWTDSQIAI